MEYNFICTLEYIFIYWSITSYVLYLMPTKPTYIYSLYDADTSSHPKTQGARRGQLRRGVVGWSSVGVGYVRLPPTGYLATCHGYTEPVLEIIVNVSVISSKVSFWLHGQSGCRYKETVLDWLNHSVLQRTRVCL